ncbi:unnamed protein product, partial [Mesorhabditis spiculigera]
MTQFESPTRTLFRCTTMAYGAVVIRNEEIASGNNDHYWSSQPEADVIVIAYAVICSFGGLANLLVFMAFLRTPALRNIRNTFIFNLAVSDLTLCLFTAPATLYLSANLYWPLGDLSCKLVAATQALNTFVSSLTLALIALDRALLTLCPIRWRLSSSGPLLFYGLVWLLSALVAVPYAFAVSAVRPGFVPWSLPTTESILTHCGREMPLICRESDEQWTLPFSKLAYTSIVLAVQYILPLAALLYAYMKIGSTIRRRSELTRPADSRRRSLMQQKNRKAMLLLVVLVLTYAVAWAPINIYHLLSGIGWINFSQLQYLICHVVGISSACLNPLIYALTGEPAEEVLIALDTITATDRDVDI